MKITGGKFNSRKIDAPDESLTRPTLSKVRMGVFNTLKSIVLDYENLKFLDLFGGSGIMGLEAISRGFKQVLVFEKNYKVASIIKNNYKNLGIKADLKVGDSLKLISKLNETFDVIYIDPPYKSGIYEEVLELIKPILKTTSVIICESDENLNIPEEYFLIKQKVYGGKIISYYSIKTTS